MGRIAQAFSLAERYVGAFERFVEASRARDEHHLAILDRQTVALEARTASEPDRIEIPDAKGLTEGLMALVAQLGGLEGIMKSWQAALPNGKAEVPNE